MIPRHSLGLYLLILCLMHIVVRPLVEVRGIAPDFFLLLVAAVALRWGAVPGSLIGFLLGFSQDAFAVSHLGMGALTKTVVGYLVGRARLSVYGYSIAFGAALIAFIKWTHDALYFTISTWGDPSSLLDQLLIRSPLSALYTALGGVVLLTLFHLLGD